MTVNYELVSRRASDIVPRKISWLWPDRFAIGKFNLIAGHPGLGKSQLTLHFAAQTSTGGSWPNGEGAAEKGSVIILSVEDDADDTIVPRLLAAGANLDKVEIVEAVIERSSAGKTERTFNVNQDVQALCDLIDRLGDVRLVIIDPISAYLGDGKKVDSHKNTEVRAALAPLQARAAQLGFAILGISHLNKGVGQEAIMRVLGSTAFVAAARAVFLVAADRKEERALFIPAKNNLGRKRPGLGFRTVTKVVSEEIETSAIEWDLDEITITADEALAAAAGAERSGEGKQGARREAMEFLRAILREGPLAANYVKKQGKAAGIKERTLQRAKEDLNIESQFIADVPEWRWILPKQIILKPYADD